MLLYSITEEFLPVYYFRPEHFTWKFRIFFFHLKITIHGSRESLLLSTQQAYHRTHSLHHSVLSFTILASFIAVPYISLCNHLILHHLKCLERIVCFLFFNAIVEERNFSGNKKRFLLDMKHFSIIGTFQLREGISRTNRLDALYMYHRSDNVRNLELLKIWLVRWTWRL